MATPIIPARWFACTLDVVYVDPTQQVPSSRVKPPHYQKAFDPGMRAHKPDRWLPWASPYKPYSVRDEKSSSSDQPTLHSTGSFQTLLDILETNYEFRKELCENLSAADVTNMANAFGLKLSHSEKRKYLNPAKVITGQFPAVQECIDNGWGVTVLGPDSSKVINSLINPVNGSKRCVRPENIEGHHYNLPDQLTKCLLLFTAPQLGTDTKKWQLTSGTEAEYQEFQRLQHMLSKPTYSEWSCMAFKMISTVHGRFHMYEQRRRIPWPAEGYARDEVGSPRSFPKALNMIADKNLLRSRDTRTRSRPGSTVRYMNLHCAPEEMKMKTLGLRDGGCLLEKMIN